MKTAIVKLSDLMRENRMDAGFHIALSEVRDRVDELKATLSADEARAKLDAIPLTDKAPLMVLSRGTRTLNVKTVETVVKEYPHLSLAIMEQNLSSAIERISAEIARNQAGLDALLALQPQTQEPAA